MIWQRVVDYNLAHNPLAQPPAKKNDPGEAATSPKAETVRAITTPGTSHTDTPTIDPRNAAENYRFDVPVELEVNRHGTISVCGYGLYIGLRFKSRKLFSIVTPDNVAEFYTAHDGEFLFSVPLPIRLTHRPAGGQININHVEGMKHRQPPKLRPDLSKPRPKKHNPDQQDHH